MRNKNAIDRMVKLGLLTALSILLVYLIHFPIFPSASYLEYDMADVPILIGTFLFGPWWGLLLTAVVSVLQWVLVSPASGWVGAIMHFFATGSCVLVAGLLYEKLKKNTLNIYVSLIISMISGRVVWGIARLIISGVTGTEFTWQLFIGGAVLQAVPGIILHILLIPIIVMALRRAKLID